MRIPWFYISIFVALALFYYVNQRTRNRRDDQRERLKQARQDYLDSLLKEKEKPGEEDSDNKD